MPHHLLAVAGLAALSFFFNLLLGRWRASLKKFSALWFIAVHFSIPFIVVLRLAMGLNAWFIPFSLGAAVAGQLVGGISRNNLKQEG